MVDLRSSLTATTTAQTGQCEEAGRETLARLQGTELLGLGAPPARSKNPLSAASTMSVTAYPRSFNLHALLRA